MKTKKKGTKPIPAFKLVNGKTEFANCRLLPESGIICVRLGLDRKKPSSFNFESERISIAAHVRKGKDRDECQDAAMIFVSDSIVATGVFDGHNNAGTFLSEKTADLLIESLAANPKNHDPLPFVVRQISDLPRPQAPLNAGGTTTAFFSVVKDGDVCLSSVGDSAAYIKERSGIRRCFKYWLDHSGDPVSKKSLDAYIQERHRMKDAIGFDLREEREIERDGLILYPNENLILVTDGVTKNLTVRFDPGTRFVTDDSGCGDLSRIIRSKSTPSDIISAILGAIDERLERKDADRHKMRPYRLYGKGVALRPGHDDIAIVVLNYNAPLPASH